jgi:methionyl-tRNA formyltransferase
MTIMRVTEGLDSGPVALAEEIAIEEGDDYASLSEKLAELGGVLLVRALDALKAGELDFTDQDDARATYAEKVSPEERHLRPSLTGIELERVVRALTPHVGTYLELDGGDRLGVRGARAVSDGPAEGALEATGDGFLLGTADGALRLDVVQPPGRKPMSAADFLRGHPPPEKAI